MKLSKSPWLRKKVSGRFIISLVLPPAAWVTFVVFFSTPAAVAPGSPVGFGSSSQGCWIGPWGPWRPLLRSPLLPPWLLAAHSDHHLLLLHLLPHLASSLEKPWGVEPELGFAAFLSSGCLQPAAFKASSTGLRTLALLPVAGFFRVGHALPPPLFYAALWTFLQSPCSFSSCLCWGCGAGVAGTEREITGGPPSLAQHLKVLLPGSGQQWHKPGDVSFDFPYLRATCCLPKPLLPPPSEAGGTLNFYLESQAALLES